MEMKIALATATDEELISIIRVYDVLERPLERRFEGDDVDLVNFLDAHGMKQDIVTKTLIIGAAMREALTRGLQIPRGN